MQRQTQQTDEVTILVPEENRHRRGCINATLVFLIFLTLFVVFRSKQYAAVDGALRCLEVYYRQALFFHENNHLLYPANILLWTRTLNNFGFNAAGPFEFVSLSQAMNCTAAAGSLALLYTLTWLATSSTAISWCAVLALGLSRAFLAHATNSAEPMVGLFFSFLALLIVVASLRSGRTATIFFGGLCFAMAMATYRSMILIAPLAGLLCLGWPQRSTHWRSAAVAAIIRATVLVAGMAVGLGVIYGLAYWHQGARTTSEMIRMFFVIGGHQEVYGGFRISSFANIPAGLAGNILPVLHNYSALRSFFTTGTLFEKARLVLALILMFGILGLAISVVSRNARFFSRSQVLLLSALVMTLLIVAWPLMYGGPLYDKFWLQPLALLVFMIAVLCAIERERFRRGLLLRTAIALLIVLEAATNLRGLVRDHTHETEALREASIVARRVGPKDAVVVDFDPISTVYYGIWGIGRNSLVFPAMTREGASEWMTQAVASSHKNGGAVYFLGILDQSESVWNSFLGERVKIPYHDLDEYRRKAQIIESFPYRNSRITLRRMTLD